MFLRKPFKYSYFRATLIIILINVAVFALQYFDRYITSYLAMCPGLVIYRKAYWQFLTYMFTHEGLSHLFFNMFALFIFGINFERAVGSKEFLMFYLVTGIFSGLCSFGVYVATGSLNVFLLGASGAVYAVLFAYAVTFPKSMIFIWGVIPVPAPILVLIYAIIEVVSELFYPSGVAHLTHLFGFLGAWLYFVIRMGIHPIKIWKNAYKK